MMKLFQSRRSIVRDDEDLGNVDKICQTFRSAPMFEIAGEEGKSVLCLTREHIPWVDIKRRGTFPYVTALNDIRQTENEGWVPFLNGHIPLQPLDRCITREGDLLVWVFMPVRNSKTSQLVE